MADSFCYRHRFDGHRALRYDFGCLPDYGGTECKEAGSNGGFSSPRAARLAAELAAVLPNPVRRSARTPTTIVRRLAGLYERRAVAHPAFDACVRAH